MNLKLFFALILWICIVGMTNAASPHGKELKIDCATCHQTENWTKIKEKGFNHNQTKFPLTGQHVAVSCKNCHSSLVFSDAKTECNSCHNDVHEGTVGKDCEQCHTTNTWIVSNIRQIHQNQGFTLLGAHATADCNRCHLSTQKLRFEKINSDCFSCHKSKYYATANPNHIQAGFDTGCNRCHNVQSPDWAGKGYNHNFFPLYGGHDIDCKSCHKTGYKGLSNECVSCHLTDYNNAKNPAHASANFSKDCKSCHSIKAWKPATFNHDKQYFPIYSGSHKGEWNNCNECHTNANNYADFTCTNCHEHSKSRMDSKHDDVRNYVYNSKNCYSCHPTGKAD